MATVQYVEGMIHAREGFVVRFRFTGPGRTPGRNVRGDRAEIPPYPFLRAAPGAKSVAWWLEQRFDATYPGFTADIVDGSGRRVHGRTQLRTLRSTYS